jgi:hypothetical protein
MLLSTINAKNLTSIQDSWDMNTAPIGHGLELDFPADIYILGDAIYPCEYPVITPYRGRDIIRQPARRQRKRRKYKRLHGHRIYVEHVMKELNTVRVIGSIYRHPRWELALIVEMRLDVHTLCMPYT